MDSSTLVSVNTPISNVQKNSPEVKNEPLGVLITLLREIPNGTKTSSSRTTDCEDNGQWTEVRRGKHQNKPKESLTLAAPTRVENKLSPGQAKVVQEAEQRLTTPQREMIEKRAHVVGVPHSFRFGQPCDDDNMSWGEGPSKGKGKGPDPGNWGGIDFANEDINLDAQRTALETWKTVQEWACSQSDVPRIEELPNNDTGKAYGHVTSHASVPAGPPVVPEAVKHIDSCQGNVESSSEDTETSKEVTSKKHKKRTHKRKD